MARRTVYGNRYSENLWPMVDTGSCTWVRIPGAEHVSLQIQNGPPLQILRAFAADFHAYVEPLRDADSACWTATNSVATSNHLSGTGMDLNWNGADNKTFRLGISKAQAYPGDKARALDELLAWYEGTVFCGGNWSIRDWMHMQCGGETYDRVADRPTQKTLDFIARKIRPDGFSSYKRSATPGPVTPPATPSPTLPAGGNQVDVLARATGITTAKATDILTGVVNGLRDSQCGNVNRIAMWLAQMGHESAGFNATEEYATGDAYEGRRDLGNTQPGDGRRFKGRSWIQVTGRSNYTALSKWAYGKGIVPTADFFIADSTRLARIEYAGLGPAWYWTVARPDINALSDQRDLVTVTKRINGGTNGLTDRQNRYNRASALGDQLLALTTAPAPAPAPTEGFLMALSDAEQREVLTASRELTKRFPSRSPLRHLGEGLVDSAAGFILNTDGHGHVQLVDTLARLGHPESLALLREVAAADPVKYPDRQDDKLVAQAILADITAPNPVAASSSTPAAPAPVPQVTAVVDTSELRAAYEEIAKLREENARLQAEAAARPADIAPVFCNINTTATDTPEAAASVIRSVQDWTQTAIGMGTPERAALAASLKVLALENGNQQ